MHSVIWPAGAAKVGCKKSIRGCNKREEPKCTLLQTGYNVTNVVFIKFWVWVGGVTRCTHAPIMAHFLWYRPLIMEITNQPITNHSALESVDDKMITPPTLSTIYGCGSLIRSCCPLEVGSRDFRTVVRLNLLANKTDEPSRRIKQTNRKPHKYPSVRLRCTLQTKEDRCC